MFMKYLKIQIFVYLNEYYYFLFKYSQIFFEKVEIVEMMNELQSANEKIDDQRDKDTIRKMRREIEELK